MRKLIAQPRVFLQQVIALQRLQKDAAHLLAVPGLGDVAVDMAHVDRFDQHIHIGISRHDDRHRQGRDLLGSLEKLKARQLGHPLVSDDDRHTLLRQDRKPLLCRLSRQNPKAFAKIKAKGVQVIGLVVHDQHRQRLRIKAKPRAGRLPTARFNIRPRHRGGRYQSTRQLTTRPTTSVASRAAPAKPSSGRNLPQTARLALRERSEPSPNGSSCTSRTVGTIAKPPVTHFANGRNHCQTAHRPLGEGSEPSRRGCIPSRARV